MSLFLFFQMLTRSILKSALPTVAQNVNINVQIITTLCVVTMAEHT